METTHWQLNLILIEEITFNNSLSYNAWNITSGMAVISEPNNSQGNEHHAHTCTLWNDSFEMMH